MFVLDVMFRVFSCTWQKEWGKALLIHLVLELEVQNHLLWLLPIFLIFSMKVLHNCPVDNHIVNGDNGVGESGHHSVMDVIENLKILV
jgi:hypothetical protein